MSRLLTLLLLLLPLTLAGFAGCESHVYHHHDPQKVDVNHSGKQKVDVDVGRRKKHPPRRFED